MKRILILVLALFLAVPAMAQMSIKDGMARISERYGVNFVFDTSLPVNARYRGKDLTKGKLEDNLESLFRGSGIVWERHKKFIVLTAESREVPVELPPVPVEISFQMDTIMASMVTDRIDRDLNSTQTGLTKLDSKKLKSGFALFNSPDIVKTIQRLPGVASGTELLSGLYVHGGTGSDNLYLLDGVPLYSASHLVGLFFSFNSDVVEEVDFYKSGFPARYGGRLSSVIDVNTRPGDMYKWHGSFSLGLIDGRFQIDGPIVNGRTSLNFGIRRTWLDTFTTPALAILNKKEGRPYGETYNGHYAFWDVNLCITHIISDSDRLQLSLFNGMDRLHGSYGEFYEEYDKVAERRTYYEDRMNGLTDLALAWGSTTAGLSWDHVFTDRMSVRTRAYYARSKNLTRLRVDSWTWEKNKADDPQNTSWQQSVISGNDRSFVNDFCLRSDFDWIPSGSHHLRFGAALQHHIFNPDRKSLSWNATADSKIIGTDVDSDKKYRGEEAVLYIEDEIRIGKRFTAAPGIRLSSFFVDGNAYFSPEPRLAMRYILGNDVALKLSYTDMTQYAHLVQTVYIDLPTSSWLPCTAQMKPMHSRQLAGGIHARLPHDIHLEVEGFWKTLSNLYEYSGGFALYPPVEKWETSFSPGKGRSYGGELSFGWTTDRTDISVAYTLSWSQRLFPEFYYTWYNDRNDYRNMLNITATHKFSDRFDIYGGWTYRTGSRMTMADQGIDPSIYEVGDGYGNLYERYHYDEIYTEPFGVRMPAYHRLDIGMNFRKTTKRGNKGIWNLSVYNAYCRMNPIAAEIYADTDTGDYVGKSYGIIPIIPTVSYTIKF